MIKSNVHSPPVFHHMPKNPGGQFGASQIQTSPGQIKKRINLLNSAQVSNSNPRPNNPNAREEKSHATLRKKSSTRGGIGGVEKATLSKASKLNLRYVKKQPQNYVNKNSLMVYK